MKTRAKIIILIPLLLCVAGGALLFWTYRELHTPFSHEKSDKYIEIPRGLTPSQIVSKLASEGVIRHEWPLLAYIKWTGAGGRLKAGEYRFPSPISPLDVLSKLEEGEQRLSRFTVIEGWSRWEIAAAMTRVPELNLVNAEAALPWTDC